MTETEFIESMKVLNIQAGDILVLKYPYTITMSSMDTLKKAIRSVLPADLVDKIKVVVLDNGMDIGVLRGEP